MEAQALTWFITPLIGLVVVLMLVIAAVLLPRAVPTLTARFYCPWAHRRVLVRYLTTDGRQPVCVMSCTAFADPRVVTCGMPCLAGVPGVGVQNAADVSRD